MSRRTLRWGGWGLIAVAALSMGTAGIYQFGWSSIRLPLGTRIGAPEPALGTIFTLFIAFQTLGQFPAGWVRDRLGPRVPMAVGAVLLASGFAGIGVADTFPEAAIAYVVGGLGVSVVYTVSINTAVKWFPDRRGLATGVVGMSYGAVSFLLIPAIRTGVDQAFARTVFALGLGIAGVAVIGAVVLRDPSTTQPDGGSDATKRDPTDWPWRMAVRTWQFWLLYVVFVIVNGVGLMLIGKIVSFAGALSLPATAATAGASLVALTDAGGVLVGGGLSDRFGRARTVAISLVLAGVALGLAVTAGVSGLPSVFVALVGAAAFFRSPPFAVFPSIVADYYGSTYSSENYAALYTAKLFGGVIGGSVASIFVVTIGWATSFMLGAGFLAVAGVALLLIRPVERHSTA